MMFFLYDIALPLLLLFYRSCKSQEATHEIYFRTAAHGLLLDFDINSLPSREQKRKKKVIHSLSQRLHLVCIKHLFPAHRLWSGFRSRSLLSITHGFANERGMWGGGEEWGVAVSLISFA